MLYRSSPVPIYHQLKELLAKGIRDGKYKNGDMLPTEFQLMEDHGISRNTARLALQALENDGLVLRQAGKGTFVKALKLEYPLPRLTSFTQDMQQKGLTPGSIVLRAEVIEAGLEHQRLLNLKSCESVFCLERLRTANSKPIGLHTACIPERVLRNSAVEHSDFAEESLYRFLQDHCSIHLTDAEESIEATGATQKVAKLLDIPEHSPVLSLKRLSYTSFGEPIEYVEIIYPGDRYRYTVHLSAN